MTAIRLITVGLSEYPKQPDWRVEAAADSRRRVERLLADHGIPAEDWTRHAISSKINKRFRKWIEKSGESHVIYWVGHGEYSAFGYRLALSDSSAPLTGENAVAGSRLSEAIRDHLARRGDDPEWTLIILDTCGSYEGLDEVYKDLGRPRNLGIIATTEPGADYAGTFATNLERALAEFTGNDTAGIRVRELARRLEDHHHEVQAKFAETALLPNRMDSPPPAQTTLADYAELALVLRDAPREIRDHFYAKAQGAEISEPAWYFTGRTDERRRLADWLRATAQGMFVVSGIAGSGKSALLGMMLATSDQAVLAALEKAGHDPVPDELRPGDLTYDAVIHLSGRTIGETVEVLSNSLHLDADTRTTDELVAQIRQRVAADRTTILVDALDESRDPLAIASLLRQVASVADTRILVGTRQSLHEDPDTPEPPDADVLIALGVDAAHTLKLGRDPAAVCRYVNRRLKRANLPGGLSVTDIANTVANAPQPFLFARLAVHEILAQPHWAASQAALTELLSGGHRDIFGRCVDRLAASAAPVEALVHALAYARGRGFPRTDGIWAIAATAITQTPINDVHVRQATELAAPYIMVDTEFGNSVYRLAHRTFVEWYHRRDAL